MNVFERVFHEFQSRPPEKVFVDFVYRRADVLFLAGIGIVWHVLSPWVNQHIPSIWPYVPPAGVWLLCAVSLTLGPYSYFNFTQNGRRQRLLYLLTKVHKYKAFTHEQEMEALSQMHSRTREAAMVSLMTMFLAIPLMLAIYNLTGIAIIADITNNIKGTHLQPPLGKKIFFQGYGIILGGCFSWVLWLLGSAHEQSCLLSGKYRRKRIGQLQKEVVRLRSKFPKKAPGCLSSRSATAPA